MDEHYRILLAEDDLKLRDIVSRLLMANGYDVDVAADGDEACSKVVRNTYDLMILDIMMPGKDGREVCKFVREKYDVPIVFLTALNKESDVINGYEIGADEYITKPFSTSLLIAKVNALIKRYKGLIVKKGILKVDEIEIELALRSVRVNGQKIDLSPKDYDLLMFFIDNKNIILSRDQILDDVWGMEYSGYDRAVDTHVKSLRASLGTAGAHIETVFKAGYVWK